VTDLRLSRPKFDVGLLTNRGEQMLDFWTEEIGLPVERTLEPVSGVIQHKLTLHGAVLKLNCVAQPLPARGPLSGIRMLLLADSGVDVPQHLRDPDGNQLCFVPPGMAGVDTYGVHLAVSDEAAFHRFYKQVLGLRRVGERTYDFAGATISFAWSPDVIRRQDQVSASFSYLTFQVMDVFEAHDLLHGRGAEEERAPSGSHTTTDSTISFILDPDGNRIEISQRPDLVASALASQSGVLDNNPSISK
jgi:catechol 2,3-dioxygenase-like lactoylglutathione lyase family enzyme